jgi:hypothetical protein
MQIKNREKVLLLAAALVIALLAGDKLVLSPLTNLWKERSNRIQELTKSVNGGKLLLERERSIQDRWTYMKSNALPANISMAESRVLKAVDRWTQSSRINFASLKPQWRQNAGDYMTLDCRADATGDMQSLARFLFELEKDPMAIKIEEMEIASRDNFGQQLSIGVRFTGLLLINDTK